ncbi:MAG: CmcJ/NvfI family oxidoreductase [Pseudomonadota bacterium]
MREAANVNYHVRSTAPQAFEFDVDGVVGELASPELVATQVWVQDLRKTGASVAFEADGILFERHHSATTSFDDTRNWQASYDAELRALLIDTIGADEVIVFDHTVRIDEPTAARRPARNVHNDYSAAGAEQRLIDIVGATRAAEFRRGHYAFVNVWRPIEQPIQSSPLGFIRPSSIAASDWVEIGLIYPDRVGQILGVTANQQHDWFYLSAMTPDDVAIFNIYDNGSLPHLGHSALDMPGESPTTPRKSIESRTLVRYAR